MRYIIETHNLLLSKIILHRENSKIRETNLKKVNKLGLCAAKNAKCDLCKRSGHFVTVWLFGSRQKVNQTWICYKNMKETFIGKICFDVFKLDSGTDVIILSANIKFSKKIRLTVQKNYFLALMAINRIRVKSYNISSLIGITSVMRYIFSLNFSFGPTCNRKVKHSWMGKTNVRNNELALEISTIILRIRLDPG